MSITEPEFCEYERDNLKHMLDVSLRFYRYQEEQRIKITSLFTTVSFALLGYMFSKILDVGYLETGSSTSVITISTFVIFMGFLVYFYVEKLNVALSAHNTVVIDARKKLYAKQYDIFEDNFVIDNHITKSTASKILIYFGLLNTRNLIKAMIVLIASSFSLFSIFILFVTSSHISSSHLAILLLFVFVNFIVTLLLCVDFAMGLKHD